MRYGVVSSKRLVADYADSSDVHFWKTGCIGSLVFEGDCIIGHEAAGVVIRVGEEVADLQPGKQKNEENGVLLLMPMSRRPGGC